MQLVTELLKENSRRNVNRIVKMAEENPELVKDLVALTIRKEVKVPMRSSWVLTHCYDSSPEIVKPYISDLIKASPNFLHTGIRRNILRILVCEEIPDDLKVFMFDHCLEWVISKKEPIAVKAHAMEILANIAQQEPDFKNEVIPIILDIMPNGSMGIRSRAKKVLKKLGYWEEEID